MTSSDEAQERLGKLTASTSRRFTHAELLDAVEGVHKRCKSG